jgi:hypothetical protein
VVAERGVSAAAEYSGHPSPTSVERRPPHRIDAASDEVKATSLPPMLDRAGAEAKREQLLTGHDPVLLAR